MTKNKYLSVPDQIINGAESGLTNKQGLFIEGVSSGVLSDVVIVDDLGDFIPFIGYFGREDIVDRHLSYLEKNKNSIYFDKVFAYSDFLFGLLWYSRYGKYKKRAIDLAVFFGEKAYKSFFKNGISSVKKHGFKLPFFSSLDATFIEVWAEFYRDTKDGKYLNYANELYETMSGNKTFKKYGLLPEWIPVGRVSFLDNHIPSKKFKRARLMKNNTSFGFALVDLYKITSDVRVKDTLDHLIKGVSKYAINNGGVLPYAFSDEYKIPYLTPSFAMVDMLCDAYSLTSNKSYIDLAKTIGDFWINEQSKTTNLFPNEAYGKDSYLDSETDMATAFFKLNELTDDGKYLDSAYKTIDGILKFHNKNGEYVLQVDINNGEVTNSAQKTKFSLLLLKPFVYISENTKIYSNNKLFDLLKDR